MKCNKGTGCQLLVSSGHMSYSLSASTELEIWLLHRSEEGSRGFLWTQSFTWLVAFGDVRSPMVLKHFSDNSNADQIFTGI